MPLTRVNRDESASSELWAKLPAPAKWVAIGGVLLAALLCFNKYEDLANAPLTSPWDSMQLASDNAPYVCPVDAMRTQSSPLPGSQSGAGAQTAASSDQVALVRYLASTEAAADSYVATGGSAPAHCALQLLEMGSEKDGYLSYAHDLQIQHLTAGALSICLLKIRTSHEFGERTEDVESITTSIRRLLAPTIDFYEKENQRADGEQVWAAYDMIAFSILTSDGSLYERASNLLNTALWTLAPTLESRRPASNKSIHCDKLLMAITPAALAFDLQAAAGLPTARHQLALLHEVALECVDDRTPRGAAKQQTTAIDRGKEPQQNAAWLSQYISNLPGPLPPTDMSFAATPSVWTGGSLP